MRSIERVKLWTFDHMKHPHQREDIHKALYSKIYPSQVSPEDLEGLTIEFENLQNNLNTIVKAQNQLQKIIADISNKENDNDVLPENIELMLVDLQGLKEQLEQLQINVNNINNKDSELKAALTEEVKSKIEKLYNELSPEIEAIKTIIQKIKDKSLVDVAILSSMVNNNSRSFKTLKEMTGFEISVLKEKNKTLKKDIIKNTKDFSLLVDFVNGELNKIKESSCSIDDIQDLQQMLDSLDQKIVQVKSKNQEESLVEDFNKLKKKHRSEIKDLQDYIKDTRLTLLRQIGEMKKQLEDKSISSELSNKIDNIKRELENKLNNVKTSIVPLPEEIENLKTKNTALKSKLDDLSRKTEDFSWRNTLLNQKVTELKKEVYDDMNLVRSDVSSDFNVKFQKLDMVQSKNTNAIEDASMRIIETSRNINEARESIYRHMNEISEELESKLDQAEDEIESMKEDLTDIKTGNFVVGTNTLSNTISEMKQKQNEMQNIKNNIVLIQLFAMNIPMRPRGLKIPLHTGEKDYTFYTNGKILKLVIKCNVSIQVFLNNNLLTVINNEQPDVVNLNKDINSNDVLHFIPPSDHAKNFYVEIWFEKS